MNKFSKKLKLLVFTLVIAVAIWILNYWKIEKVIAADISCSYNAVAYQDLKLNDLEQELEGTGLIGEIHGARREANLFVLSVREDENFFNHREFSLLASNETNLKALSEIKRHDRVCIKGRFIPNPSEQKHILVQSLKIIKSWSNPSAKVEPYQRQASIPEELLNKTSFVGKVHAVAAEGKVMVVEYKDAVIPVFVESPQLTKDLYRGDIIRISYRLQNLPIKPTHLRLNLEQSKPLEVVDSMAAWHEKDLVVKGYLVKFPQSPQIKFDVYAIAVETGAITRNFTLVNFQDAAIFQEIRDKLAQIWDGNLSTATSGRNMLINQDLILEVRGRGNVISPEQANPQILLSGVEDIKVCKGYVMNLLNRIQESVNY